MDIGGAVHRMRHSAYHVGKYVFYSNYKRLSHKKEFRCSDFLHCSSGASDPSLSQAMGIGPWIGGGS